MLKAHLHIARSCQLLSVVTALTLFASWSSASCEAGNLIRVEEDWMVLVKDTEAGSTCPQMQNIISPNHTLSSVYGMVELNHGSYPRFQAGGMQLHAYDGGTLLSSSAMAAAGPLRIDNDRLEYTVSLIREPSGTYVELSNIRSKTWSSLNLAAQRQKLSAESIALDEYSPADSAQNSSVIVAANRVSSMCITQTRYIYDDGEVVVDPTVRMTARYQDAASQINLSEFSN